MYTVGQSVKRIDADAKVLGTAQFGDDERYPGMLYLKGVYAKYAHAKILSVDTSEAEKMPGVAIVVTAKDIPCEKMIGEIFIDQYVLADDKTRYLGDVVAVVAADTQEQANEAAKHVKVEYEPLPVLSDPRTAIGNEQVINPDYPDNIWATRTFKLDLPSLAPGKYKVRITNTAHGPRGNIPWFGVSFVQLRTGK